MSTSEAGSETDFSQRYSHALGEDLGDDEVGMLLELAREVAHGTERRFAPLCTFAAGRYVAARVAQGATASDALTDAVQVARSLLGDEPEDHDLTEGH